MEKTAMEELLYRMLIVVQELKEPSKTSQYLKAYRDAIINVANDIEAQMIQLERQQMKDAYLTGKTKHPGLKSIFENQFEDYFTSRYGNNPTPGADGDKEI